VNFSQATNVSVYELVRFDVCWIFAFDLDRPYDNSARAWLRDDEIKSSVAMRKVDVPTRVCELAGYIKLREII